MASSFLDYVETLMYNTHQFTVSHRKAVKAFLGAAMLFHGHELLGTVLILQGIQVAGTELMDKSLNDLYETYKQTRLAFKENMPSVAEIVDLQRKLAAAADDLRGRKITPENYQKVAKDMEELQTALHRSQSFMQSVMAAVNPSHLGEIMRSLHMYCLSVTAVATSTTAATITVGLNIGRTIADRTYYMTLEFREWMGYKNVLTNGSVESPANGRDGNELQANREEWVKMLIQIAGNSIGLSISYFMQKTSLMFGACMMGSDFILTAFEDLVDPYLEKAKFPTLKGNQAAKTMIQSSLVAVGFVAQIRGGRSFGLKFVMTPLYITEAIIQTYIFARIIKKDL